jgi:hypothetical protein
MKSHDIGNLDPDHYGGFEKMLLHEEYLGVLSIITKYQNLQSWFVLYRFDRSNGNLKLVYNFSIPSVCEEFDFVKTSETETMMKVTVSIICNKDIATRSLKFFQFEADFEGKNHVLPRQVSVADIDDVWSLKIFVVKNSTGERQLAVQNTGNTQTALRYYQLTPEDELMATPHLEERFDDTVRGGYIFELENFDQHLFIYLHRNLSLMFTSFNQVIRFDRNQKHLITFDSKHQNANLQNFECINTHSKSIKCFVYFQKNNPTTFEVSYAVDRSDEEGVKVRLTTSNIVDHYMLPDIANDLEITLTDEFLIADTLHINPGKLC